MADVSSTLRAWSATAASNNPSGGTVIGAGLDDNLRQIQATVRQFLAAQATNMASATIDLSTADGFYVNVTGTTTITALGTEGAGIHYVLKFAGALTFTHNSTSLILPGAQNITTTAGDLAWMISEGAGNWRCLLYTKAFSTSIPRSYLSGLTLSTAGASTTMTTAAGQATDSTNAASLGLAASIGKTTSAWAVGSGNGGLDTGAIANSTWYHFWLIQRSDTGVVDVLISLSASAPTMPANYTYKRRIGSGKTNGSGQWTSFTQEGDNFLWAVPVSDYASANPGTAAVTRTLTVPTGVVVLPIHSVLITQGGTGAITYALYTSLAQTDTAPSATLFTVAVTTDTGTVQNMASMVNNITTDTSAQIRTRISNSAAGTTLSGATHGWVDHRGRDS